MSQPPAYTKTASFAGDESNAAGGRSTVRTAALDAELSGIETTLDATLANLALIQRDDGEFRDAMVKLPTLGNDVRALLAAGQGMPMGAWVTATAYALRDVVTQSGNTYLCSAAHTSGTFATDLAAGKWLLMTLGAGPSASAVVVTPTGSLVATNAQAALAELDIDLSAAVASIADSSNAAKGAGQVGFLYSLAYGAGTIGKWLKDLALSSGASFIGWIQSGTGAVLRTIQDKLRETPSALDFGADNTGATDCGAALLAYIADAKLNSREVVFTAGTYKYSSTLPFDWTRARARFKGQVTLQYTGTGKAVSIDGGASGSLYDVRFGEGNAPMIRCDNGTHGVYVRSLGHGIVNADVLSAGTAGLLVEFAVACEFGIRCTKNAQAGGNWVSTVPVNGMILNQRNAGEGVADCVFKNCIIEGVSGTGVTGDFLYRSTFEGGTSEGNGGGGYAETANSGGNLLLNFFCEANAGADFTLSGADSTRLVNCTNNSAVTASQITRGASIEGGEFSKLTITSSAIGTMIRGALLNPAGFTDSGSKTVYENVKYVTAAGAPVIPDAARKPKMKRIGALPITAATKAARCVVTIPNHRLDYGESIAIASVGGMTNLNGNTYQVEPIDETDSVYLLSGGAYVNSTAFGTYTSGGTATYAAFGSTWAVGGGAYRDPGFFKDQSGIVHLFGAIKGTSLSGVSAFTLPAGFRPSATVTYPAWELTPSAALVQITSAGAVTPSGYTDGANKVIALDGISFLAEG